MLGGFDVFPGPPGAAREREREALEKIDALVSKANREAVGKYRDRPSRAVDPLFKGAEAAGLSFSLVSTLTAGGALYEGELHVVCDDRENLVAMVLLLDGATYAFDPSVPIAYHLPLERPPARVAPLPP